MTDTGLRPAPQTAPAATEPRSHYLLIGLAVAGLWLLNRDKSLLYHAVQMGIIMSAFTLLQVVLRRHGDLVHASRGAYTNLFSRLLAAKLAMVGLAVLAEWLLAPDTSRSNGIVATFLVVVVTALGPVADRRAISRSMPATTRPLDKKGLIHD